MNPKMDRLCERANAIREKITRLWYTHTGPLETIWELEKSLVAILKVAITVERVDAHRLIVDIRSREGGSLELWTECTRLLALLVGVTPEELRKARIDDPAMKKRLLTPPAR